MNKERQRVAPDRAAGDGKAAIAIILLAVVLIVFVVSRLV